MTRFNRITLGVFTIVLALGLGLVWTGCASNPNKCEHCKADTSPPDKTTEKPATSKP